MSSQQSNIPKKGDIIINPNTQRPIRVGGRSWLKLVKEGLVSGHYTDEMEAELERLILQEMTVQKPKKVGRPKKVSQSDEKYTLQEPELYDTELISERDNFNHSNHFQENNESDEDFFGDNQNNSSDEEYF